MRLIATARVKRFMASALIFFVLACFFALSFVLLKKDGEARAVFSVWSGSAFETKNALLMDAMRFVGSCTPEDAAKTWAEGLVKRSAALQYAVMSDMLKAEYAKRLETTAPNWVTGVSSPWVESYTIEKLGEGSEKGKVAELSFTLMTSTGEAGKYTASLLLAVENGFWRVAGISMDEALYPYTGF
ncbi:MAG TPA: hypothetical protein VN512_11040 [Clostridia bacterium]|nr:hypothetical protein [Clostridia bacterium]